MRIDADTKLDFKDVLIRPKRSTLFSRSEVSLERTYTFRHSDKIWNGVPLISANMDTTGTFETARAMAVRRCVTAIHKHYTIDEWKNFLKSGGEDITDWITVSTGISDNDMLKLQDIMSLHDFPSICIDVANGYSQQFVDAVRALRAAYPKKTIIAGNVVTGEMTEELILSGADIVKVGIGPGSVCTTRRQTGVGYPQLSAVIECADAAHGLGGLIVSDGGCTSPGDVAKAFGAGADFVMLGGLLAGHDESGGLIFEKNGKTFKAFYGMSSATAMTKHAGGVAEYRASEGKSVAVPYRGPLDLTLMDILGGIRSACTYVGAATLKELSKRTTFVRVTQQLNTVFGEASQEDSARTTVSQLAGTQTLRPRSPNVAPAHPGN